MKYLLILIGLVSISEATVADETKIPKEVAGLVSKHNCQIDTDFYALPGVIGHPFDVWVKDNGFIEIVVACTTEMHKESWKRMYTLLIQVDPEYNSLSKCPNKIIGPLGIGEIKFVPNFAPPERFSFLDNSERLSKKDEISDMAIKSEYDGAGSEFVCAGGRWAFSSFH